MKIKRDHRPVTKYKQNPAVSLKMQ